MTMQEYLDFRKSLDIKIKSLKQQREINNMKLTYIVATLTKKGLSDDEIDNDAEFDKLVKENGEITFKINKLVTKKTADYLISILD